MDVICEWARSNGHESELGWLDRDSPEVAGDFRAAVARPDRIETVERIESLAKFLWDDLLTPGAKIDAPTALGFARFFAEVGFFFKYKPYGVKIASPFGYSLFDLFDGQGFSFQIHVEPKWEAFHILRTKDRSLVYVASLPEWQAGGSQWARAFFEHRDPADPPAVWRPAGGDATAITETQTVHAVLGCVVEEYAGCSVDAVERLYDPYPRTSFTLPTAHQDPAALLRDAYPGLPRRILRRQGAGWLAAPVPTGATVAPLIDVPEEIWGARVRCAAGDRYPIPGSDEFVTVVVAVHGDAFVEVDGERIGLELGHLVCLPPQVDAGVGATDGTAIVAVHQVARRLVQTDWSR
jgi:hypothetical protein